VKFAVVSIFPEMFDAISQFGVTARAMKKGLISLEVFNPRDFTHDKHRTVDDRPFGGGPGMVMKVQPLVDAINAAKAALGDNAKVIYMSPQGKTLTQQAAQDFSTQAQQNLIFVAGRYEGIDQRIIDTMIDEQWSLGDFVLSGGELAAMTFIDAIARLVPDVLGHELSAVEDSFTDGLLDCPHYTRPEEYEDLCVPPILLSGDHKKIRLWREKQALGQTWLQRSDLLKNRELTDSQQVLLEEFKRENTKLPD
jgi:tRNA (guanine37-N1)-methyltransferase